MMMATCLGTALTSGTVAVELLKKAMRLVDPG
jgi:hypothetical protein